MCGSLIDSSGHIELIVGCMFSGKTEEFIRRIRKIEYAKKNIVVFKLNFDNRYSKNKVVSHNKNSFKSEIIDNSNQIAKYVENHPNTDVICVDEAQFFDEDLPTVLNKLAETKVIIVAGLDLDFKAEPFKNIEKLLSISDFVTKLHAVCIKCGRCAVRTQRIINGKYALKTDQQILIGSKESYEARCRKCYVLKD